MKRDYVSIWYSFSKSTGSPVNELKVREPYTTHQPLIATAAALLSALFMTGEFPMPGVLEHEGQSITLKHKHGFLYHTRTDFMPFATLKIRPNNFNVL